MLADHQVVRDPLLLVTAGIIEIVRPLRQCRLERPTEVIR